MLIQKTLPCELVGVGRIGGHPLQQFANLAVAQFTVEVTIDLSGPIRHECPSSRSLRCTHSRRDVRTR